MKTNEKIYPYELHPSGFGAFTVYQLAVEDVAFQFLSISKASLRGNNGSLMVLEYGSKLSVRINGISLAEIFDHLLAGRIKVIRKGTHEGCSVEKIELIEE